MSFHPTIVATSETTTTLELRLPPGAVVPAGRLQRGLLASVEALSGTAAIAAAGEDSDLTPGTITDLEPDADPMLWNTGPDVAHLIVELRLPAELGADDLTRTLVAVEALARLGSARDASGLAGDGVLRFALDRELEDLADLVRTPAEPALSAAA